MALAAAAPALRLAGSHAGTVADVYDRRESGSTGWAIVGYSLALILLYVFIADKRVVAASTGLVGGASGAAGAWIKPVDPLALLAQKLGYGPGSSPASSSAAGAGSTAPNPANIASGAGLLAPSPLTAGATGARQGVLQGLQDLLTGTPVNVSGNRLASVERTVHRAFPGTPRAQLPAVTQRMLEEAHTGVYVKPGLKEYSVGG